VSVGDARRGSLSSSQDNGRSAPHPSTRSTTAPARRANPGGGCGGWTSWWVWRWAAVILRRRKRAAPGVADAHSVSRRSAAPLQTPGTARSAIWSGRRRRRHAPAAGARRLHQRGRRALPAV